MDVLIALLKPKQEPSRYEMQQQEPGGSANVYQSAFADASSSASAELDASVKQATMQVWHCAHFLDELIHVLVATLQRSDEVAWYLPSKRFPDGLSQHHAQEGGAHAGFDCSGAGILGHSPSCLSTSPIPLLRPIPDELELLLIDILRLSLC